VSPATSTLAVDAQLPLQAQVRDESGAMVADAAITWTVQNPAIVSVSASGVVKALAVGTSQVAANALGKSGLAIITVSPPTTPGSTNPGAAEPANEEPAGEEPAGEQPAGEEPASEEPANGDPAEEAPADDEPAEEEPSGTEPSAVATVTVTAPSNKLQEGSTMQLTAIAKDDKGNPVSQQSFVWSSSNIDKATVSATGVVTGKRPGNVTIMAQTSSTGGKSGSLVIEVRKK
jgi:uncharacterized protein YjdB